MTKRGNPANVDNASPVGQRAPRALVVDDDPGTVFLMSETLEKSGFVVMEAFDGAEAIEKSATFEPDLILLDINMPVLDGISACAAIRKQSRRDVPIVMVTSVDDAISIQSAFDAEATDFILKPINWPLLQQRLDRLLTEWEKSSELDERHRQLDLLKKIAPERVLVVDRAGGIIDTISTDSATASSGSETLDDLFGSEIAGRMKQRVSGVLKSRQHSSLEFDVDKDGATTSYEAKFFADGREHVIFVLQNITSGQDSRSEIYELAYYDADTALPNRNLFTRIAGEQIVDSGLHGDFLTLLSIQFSNLTGEDLTRRSIMQAIASRLIECLSGTNTVIPISENDNMKPASRIRTNEFIVLLKNVQGNNDVKVVCNQIIESFTRRLTDLSNPILVSPSIGVSSFPSDGQDLDTLLHSAEAAMYEAVKAETTLCFSAEATGIRLIDTIDYGQELQQAIDDEQIEVHYLPRIDAASGCVSCVEALIRWNHPIRGYVPLNEMLHLAKASGRMIDLGELVLRKACSMASQLSGCLKVSVNLSQQEFARRDLADRVISALDASSLAAERLELELTEAALMRAEDVIADLQHLKALGIGLVLDDFGTGHTSLAYLKRYPIDALKIDGSFVRGIPNDDTDAAVVDIIVTIAQKMGMRSIAEGVETKAQLDYLRQAGCDEYQGFYFSKPLPLPELLRFLDEPTRAD